MIYAFHDSRIPRENVERLRSLGFCPVGIPECASLSPPVCAHTDLQMVQLGQLLLIGKALAERLPALAQAKGVIVDYPFEDENAHEARLCALVPGNKIFGNTKILSKRLLTLAREMGFSQVMTKQSYARCSTLFLDAHHAVTADEGMYRAMVSEGIEVLKISEGGVLLPPYPYGFIGGASGVFRDCVYFIGSLESHPDSKIIRRFIEECGMRACSLSDGALIDGGGIVFWQSDAQILLEEDA